MRELLYGARPVETLPEVGIATYAPDERGEIELEGVGLHHVFWEIPTQTGIDNLPPSLHPTWPGILALQFWRVPDSPVGPFTFAAVALGCRTAIKPRQFVLSAFASTDEARSLLAPRYGYPIQVADVQQDEYSDAVISSIAVDGKSLLEVTTSSMRTLTGSSAALKLSPHLSRANVDGKAEILQSEMGYSFKHTRRGTPRIGTLDAVALGFRSGVELSIPVAGSLASVDITLHPARFALDVEQPAEQVKSRKLEVAVPA